MVRITPTLESVPFWRRMRDFGKDRRTEVLNKFKDGAIVNEHTGLTITLSRQGLDHILDTSRANDNAAGELIYQAVPQLDELARTAYRVETHEDRKQQI